MIDLISGTGEGRICFSLLKDSGYNSRIILSLSFLGEKCKHNTKNIYLKIKD